MFTSTVTMSDTLFQTDEEREMDRRDAIDAFRVLLGLDTPASPSLIDDDDDDESMAEEMLNIDALLWPPTGDGLNSSVTSTQVMNNLL